MTKARLQGNKAVFVGNAYDLKKTVTTLHGVVCAAMDAFGVKTGKVGTIYPHLSTAVLPHPGLEQTEKVWQRVAQEYQVVDWKMIYDIGPVTFSAQLFGRSWCVYRPDRGDIVTPDGLPLAHLNNAPIVTVGGERQADGSCALLSTAKMDVMDEVLLPFGLTVDGVNCNAEEGHSAAQKRYLAYISFPYAAYGAGRKELQARCALPDGSEIKVAPFSRLN